MSFVQRGDHRSFQVDRTSGQVKFYFEFLLRFLPLLFVVRFQNQHSETKMFGPFKHA